MNNNKNVKKVFEHQEYMTQELKSIAEDFENMIEAEFILCIGEMKKTNKLAYETALKEPDNSKLSAACLEIDAIRKYWYERLYSLIVLIQYRNPQLFEELLNNPIHRNS